MIEGRRLAAIDLPLPGGPIMSTLWPPAAATSSARFSARWPRSWAKSSPSGGSAASQSPGVQPLGHGRAVAAPGMRRARARCRPGPRPGRRPAPPPPALSGGTTIPSHPAVAAASAIAIAPRTRRTDPSRPSSPQNAWPARRSGGACPEAASSAAASARSKAGPALRRSAGARFTVIRLQREVEPGVDERRPDALARLLHGRIAQAHDRERRQPRVDVGLDRDADAVDPEQREGGRTSQHRLQPRSPRVTAVAQNEPPARTGVERCVALAVRIGTFGWSPARLRRASMGAMAGDHRRALGRRGEELAATHLERHGWRIVERNFRTREGEIDLIAARRGTLAFCEVKTLIARRAPPASGPANPVESVGPAKRMPRAAHGPRLAGGRPGGQPDRTASSCAARRDRGAAGPRRYAAAARTPRECLLNLSKYKDRAELRRIPRRWVRRAYWRVVASTHRAMELRYGIRTEGDVDLEDLGVAAEHRLGYEGSHWVGVRRALSRLGVTRDDVFADFGSGKGPAVLVAATFPFRRAIGVEISDDLTRSARAQPRALAPAPARGQRRVRRRRRARVRDPGRPLGGLPLQPVHGAAVRALHRAAAAVARAPSPAAAAGLQLSLRARLRDRDAAASGRSTSPTATRPPGTAGRAT